MDRTAYEPGRRRRGVTNTMERFREELNRLRKSLEALIQRLFRALFVDGDRKDDDEQLLSGIPEKWDRCLFIETSFFIGVVIVVCICIGTIVTVLTTIVVLRQQQCTGYGCETFLSWSNFVQIKLLADSKKETIGFLAEVQSVKTAPVEVFLDVHCYTCNDYYQAGKRKHGVYSLRLWDPKIKATMKVDAFCRFDEKGGWTVLQQRYDDETIFQRDWIEYQRGFGHLREGSSFWWGLENVHLLTTYCGHEKARFEVDICNDDVVSEEFENFQVCGLILSILEAILSIAVFIFQLVRFKHFTAQLRGYGGEATLVVWVILYGLVITAYVLYFIGYAKKYAPFV